MEQCHLIGTIHQIRFEVIGLEVPMPEMKLLKNAGGGGAYAKIVNLSLTLGL